MRTLIYARFSSDLQNARSIEDQIRICRERAHAEGWEIVDVYTDYAISGAAGISQRPGLNAMLARATAGGIDQVLAESTSRIARHQGDAYSIREQLTCAKVRLFTLADGEIDDIKGWVKGFLDAQQRKDLAFNIKRAQRGVVAQGRAPAGLAFGYRRANRFDERGEVIRGLREIDPDQAVIVRRIFTEYADGSNARAIALRLNADGIAGPSGGTWRASTIHGDRTRHNGMLINRLYRGELVHNRTSKVTDPMSRKVRIRANPQSEWLVEPVPHLRIVDEALWRAVAHRFESVATLKPVLHRRPKRLLSGLVVCGICGGGYSVVTAHKMGCSRERDGGGCTNSRMITVDRLEARVIGGLQEQMLDPELVSIYVAEYHRASAEAATAARRDRAQIERRHAEASRKVDRLVAAVAEGGSDFAEIRAALGKARADRDRLAEDMREIEAHNVVALHPSIIDDYRRQMDDLARTLTGDADNREEAAPVLRSLIERITVKPAEGPRGVEIEITGRLANILALAAGSPNIDTGTVLLERAKGIEPS
ncbi:recombinase family protein [Sphingomonas sp. SRS2]|uniref:recombinase family protein n=1 Tax=Sphingomonas sp. SRS2 TaxID=133190 RepID=UPI001F33A759|nr:recombinase family protein [Sphingomonas sp. SRS2]